MDKQICEDVFCFLARFYRKGLNDKQWKECNEWMNEINQKYWGAFCSRMLGIAFAHIVRLQKGEASSIWDGSEIQQFCQEKIVEGI